MALIHLDPLRPKPVYPQASNGSGKFDIKSTGSASGILEGADWTGNRNWDIVANWPGRFIPGKKNPGENPTDLFDFEFAVGAHLDKWTDIFQDDSFWEGTAPFGDGPPLQQTTASKAPGIQWDEARAQVSDRINAIFCDAHARNRWDLLNLWYPIVWGRFARGSRPFAKIYPQANKATWVEVGEWPGWPELDKAKAKLDELFASGEAAKWMESIHKKRTEDNLPTPPWLAPSVTYRPYWWIVRNETYGKPKYYPPGHVHEVGKWLSDDSNTFTTAFWLKPQVSYPLGQITSKDKTKLLVFGIIKSVVGSVIMGGFVEGLWAAAGAPAAPAITDAIATGLQNETQGGDFADAFELDFADLLPYAGDIVSSVGGSDFISTAADLAAGNLDTEDTAMFLDSFTDGLGWLDDAVSGASDFIDQVGGIGDNLDGLANLFGYGSNDGGSVGSNGYPAAPPIFDPGEASGIGSSATPEQIAEWEKDGMLPILLIGIALLVIA